MTKNRSPETEVIATVTEFIATSTDFVATEIELIAPLTKLIGTEIKFDASDRYENGTLTDFIGRFR